MRQMVTYEDTDKMDRVDMRSIHSMGYVTPLSERQPLPENRRSRLKVVCLECERKFTTTSFIPTCPACGGSDVELA